MSEILLLRTLYSSLRRGCTSQLLEHVPAIDKTEIYPEKQTENQTEIFPNNKRENGNPTNYVQVFLFGY
jgi:methionyl-tRNA formyltransferase